MTLNKNFSILYIINENYKIFMLKGYQQYYQYYKSILESLVL